MTLALSSATWSCLTGLFQLQVFCSEIFFQSVTALTPTGEVFLALISFMLWLFDSQWPIHRGLGGSQSHSGHSSCRKSNSSLLDRGLWFLFSFFPPLLSLIPVKWCRLCLALGQLFTDGYSVSIWQTTSVHEALPTL